MVACWMNTGLGTAARAKGQQQVQPPNGRLVDGQLHRQRVVQHGGCTLPHPSTHPPVCSIFMASTTTRGSPSATLWPADTNTCTGSGRHHNALLFKTGMRHTQRIGAPTCFEAVARRRLQPSPHARAPPPPPSPPTHLDDAAGHGGHDAARRLRRSAGAQPAAHDRTPAGGRGRQGEAASVRTKGLGHEKYMVIGHEKYLVTVTQSIKEAGSRPEGQQTTSQPGQQETWDRIFSLLTRARLNWCCVPLIHRSSASSSPWLRRARGARGAVEAETAGSSARAAQ